MQQGFNKKSLGVIGGMGPEATQLFFKKIIKKTPASCDQEHIPMIILNHCTIPDRTSAILSGNTKELTSIFLKDAKFLENQGVCAIAVPCNTSHYFLDLIEEKLSVKFIHMIRETCNYINKKKSKRVGILATDGTIYTGLYQKELERLGIQAIKPDKKHQQLIMDLIYNDIKAGKNGNMQNFLKVEEYFKKENCSCAILACTELSCFAEEEKLSDFYVDAMDILAQKAVNACIENIHQPK